MRDQTEREMAREKLQQSEERNRLLVEEIQDYAIVMLDPEGRFMTWNKGFERILGYQAQEILGKSVSILYTPEDLAAGKPARELETAKEKGRNKDNGWRVRKDGSRLWSEEIISPIRKEDGTLTGFTKVIRDITLQKESEEARASQVRYLEGMEEISSVLELNLDMEQVLRLAVEKIRALFEADEAFLLHPLKPDSAHFRIPYAARKDPPADARSGIADGAAMNPGFAAALLSASDPVLIDRDHPIAGLEPCRSGSGGSLAAILVRPKIGEPWALAVAHCAGEKAEWPANDLRMFKDIALRLAGVLDNLILHRNLRDSEARFRWLVENTTEVVYRIDMREPMPTSLPREEQVERFYRDGFLAECNDAMAKRYGRTSASELIGASLESLLPGTDPSGRAFLSGFIRSGYRSLETEQVEKGPQGKTRYLMHSLVGIVDGNLLKGAWGTSRDITDRRLAEEEVRRSRDQLDVILQGIADAILVYSPSGALVYSNQAAARMLEFPDLPSGRRDEARVEESLSRMEIMDESGKPMPPHLMPVRLALRGQETPPTLLRYRLGSEGPERWLITRAKPILDNAGKVRMVISIAQDTTELRKAEEQFRQSQKMEAVGRLAGGVAHDFNNLLTAINGYSDLLLGMMEKEDSRRAYLEEIRKAGDRAASLTNQLLVYSRRQILSPQAVNLNEVASQMEMMLRRLIGEDIEFHVRLDRKIDRIKADPGQIEQVILNLVVNARDAMPKGGRLFLETDQVDLTNESACLNEAVISGPYVRLTVRDTGVGMEDVVKHHLFEPFFTTKKTGRGTGLGLSTVYGIVRQSGGCIGVESEKGKGAVFKVYFPAARLVAGEKKAAEPRADRASLSGSETILVAEDDFAVRSLVKDILKSYGYRVLEAGNGLEALEAANEYSGKIDLLLTDVIMTQMGGRELTDRMKVIRPELKTIYMSGYTDDAILRHGVFTKAETFLQKPFTPEALALKIRMVLDAVPA
jgi:PAS domain S-box-containing protein